MADPAVAPVPVAPATPPSPPPAGPAPADRPTIPDAHYDGLSHEEQNRYARVRKGPDGGSEWRLRSDLAPDGAPKPAPAADAPAGVVDGKLVIGEGDNRFELSPDDVKMLMTQKAESDVRAMRIPLDATGYKAELPKDLKLPPGVEEIKFNEGDPALADLRTFAHSRGWSQDDFSAALGIYAAKEGRETAAFHAALQAEIKKLGPGGASRVHAVEQWMRSMVGDTDAKALRSMLVAERHVRAFENLAAKFIGQGSASFSSAGRVAPTTTPGKVSDEEYARMGPGERLAYARSFDQSQFRKSEGER